MSDTAFSFEEEDAFEATSSAECCFLWELFEWDKGIQSGNCVDEFPLLEWPDFEDPGLNFGRKAIEVKWSVVNIRSRKVLNGCISFLSCDELDVRMDPVDVDTHVLFLVALSTHFLPCRISGQKVLSYHSWPGLANVSTFQISSSLYYHIPFRCAF